MKKDLLNEILPTPRCRRCGESIFDYEYLEAKIAKALTVVEGTCAERIFFLQKIEKKITAGQQDRIMEQTGRKPRSASRKQPYLIHNQKSIYIFEHW